MSAGSTGCAFSRMRSTVSRCGCSSPPPAGCSAARWPPGRGRLPRIRRCLRDRRRWRVALARRPGRPFRGRRADTDAAGRAARRRFHRGRGTREGPPAACRRFCAARSNAGWRRCFPVRALPLGGVGRGLAFQLVDALGSVPAAEVGARSPRSTRRDRKALSRLGVRFRHRKRLFRDRCCSPMRCAFAPCCGRCGTDEPMPTLPAGRRSRQTRSKSILRCHSFYAAIGFRVLDGLALRAGPDGAARRRRPAPCAVRPVRCRRPARGDRRSRTAAHCAGCSRRSATAP